MTLNAKVTVTATDNTRVFQHLLDAGGGWFLYVHNRKIVKAAQVPWLDIDNLDLAPHPVIIVPQDEEIQRRLLGTSGVLRENA